MPLKFLQTRDVLHIHQNQIELYGGEHGLRDISLLESAVAQAQATYDGAYLNHDITEMAGAYLFHIVQNHPFVDGNKRSGAVASLVFLDWNSVEVKPDNNGLVEITLAIATGRASKEDAARFFASISC